jgi:hypothetical protein
VPTAWCERLVRGLRFALLGGLAPRWGARPHGKKKVPLLQSGVEGRRKPGGRSPTSFPCPHCGLKLTIVPNKPATHSYDFEEWKRRCKFQELDSPVLCLVVREGSLSPS